MAAGAADEPAREPPDEVLLGHFEQKRTIDRPAGRREGGVEGLGLGSRSREAVEDRAVRGILTPVNGLQAIEDVTTELLEALGWAVAEDR
jgi:hypothetical protein